MLLDYLLTKLLVLRLYMDSISIWRITGTTSNCYANLTIIQLNFVDALIDMWGNVSF